MNTYHVKSISSPIDLAANWEDAVWKNAETASVNFFYPESSDHHPVTHVRLLYDLNGIHGIFRVEDQYVRCLHSRFQEDVWQDACVEFFVKPKFEAGYFNFEMNCGGALLNYYIIDPTPVGNGFINFVKLPPEDGSLVQITTTMPALIDPEISTPVTWVLRFSIPFTLLEKYVGPLGTVTGQEWRANFNKCAENNSHPHWATWNPLPEQNFHSPDYFGRLIFG
jgi:hypothetical protein